MTQPVVCDFMGRKVELRVISFGVLMEANEMMTASGNANDAVWFTLAASAYWQDTGDRVFHSTDDVMATPATHAGELMRMSKACSDLNRPDLGDMAPDPKKPANGADGEVRNPSP